MKTSVERILFVSHLTPFAEFVVMEYNWNVVSDYQSILSIDFDKFTWIIILIEIKFRDRSGIITPASNFYGLRLPQLMIDKKRELSKKIILYSNFSQQFISQRQLIRFKNARTNIYCIKSIDTLFSKEKINSNITFSSEEVLSNSFYAINYLINEQSKHEMIFSDNLKRLKNKLKHLLRKEAFEEFEKSRKDLVRFYSISFEDKIYKLIFYFNVFIEHSKKGTIKDKFYKILFSNKKTMVSSTKKMQYLYYNLPKLGKIQSNKSEFRSLQLQYTDCKKIAEQLLENFKKFKPLN